MPIAAFADGGNDRVSRDPGITAENPPPKPLAHAFRSPFSDVADFAHAAI
jgi:hypothetical protein